MSATSVFRSAARAVAGGRNAACALAARRRCRAADTPGSFACYRLPSRSLVRVYGRDAAAFLQGVITNDLSALGEGGRTCLYAHMLNVRGRTLYDIVVYRNCLNEPSEGLNSVILECDSSVLDGITQHLNTYKIRRRVTVNTCADLSLWALLPRNTRSALERPTPTAAEKVLALVEDPRTNLMGWRLIARSNDDPLDFIAACHHGDPDEYHSHRYKIGLPEGVKDLPPGEALPLESNLVVMNGISFSKGCYLGQELTARTHHTGVVRKRLLPVGLSAPAEALPAGAVLRCPGGKPAGKHRAGLGHVGLALVRMTHANDALELTSSQDRTVTVQASIPDWWPEDTTST